MRLNSKLTLIAAFTFLLCLNTLPALAQFGRGGTEATITDVETQVAEDELRFIVDFEVTGLPDAEVSVTVWVLDEYGVQLTDANGAEVGAFTTVTADADTTTFDNLELSVPFTDLPEAGFNYSVQPLVRVWDTAEETSLAFYGGADVTPVLVELVETTPDADSDGDGVANVDDRCHVASPGATGADTTGCPTEFDPFIDLTFDHNPHQLWYNRYWTGSCQNVPGFCLPGDPNWFGTVDEVLATVDIPAEDTGRLRNKLWALGRMVGHEWSSDASHSTIATGDLRGWGRIMSNMDVTNPDAAIDTVAFEANVKMRENGRSEIEQG